MTKTIRNPIQETELTLHNSEFNIPCSIFYSSRRASSSLYRCSFMSQLWRTEKMVINTTMIKQAIIRTRISEGLELMTICARLSQPEKKFMKIAAAITTPNGRPTDNCFRTFLFLSRWYCQYSTNFSSSSVSIRTTNVWPDIWELFQKYFELWTPPVTQVATVIQIDYLAQNKNPRPWNLPRYWLNISTRKKSSTSPVLAHSCSTPLQEQARTRCMHQKELASNITRQLEMTTIWSRTFLPMQEKWNL